MQKPRLITLDVLRGATIGLMIIVNNPGSWGAIYNPLQHAKWHGVTPTDWVFPFFLFIIGLSLGIVSKRTFDIPVNAYWRKVLVRSLIIGGIGLFLNAAPFIQYQDGQWIIKSWEQLRFMGVLQRIALCYFIVAITVRYCRNIHLIIAIVVGFWLLYRWLCASLHHIDSGALYDLNGYFGIDWDIYLLGGASHLYHGEGVPFDPEGIASTLPACTNILLGYIGYFYFNKYKQSTQKLLKLVSVSLGLLLFASFIWHPFFPLNKKIWTSSYALYTSALCYIIFLVSYFIFDKVQTPHFKVFYIARKKISYFFKVLGMNALFIYALNGLLVRFLWLFRWKESSLSIPNKSIDVTPWSYLYKFMLLPAVEDGKLASFLCAIIMLLLMWLIAWVLYQRKIFISA